MHKDECSSISMLTESVLELGELDMATLEDDDVVVISIMISVHLVAKS